MIRYSIIIPTYNASSTLEPLLESIAAETPSDCEVIVVDDGSTDNTPDLAARFDVCYERMPENRGPAAARNRGAELAQGEWLVFTDSDTLFLPDTLEQLRRKLELPGIDALLGAYAGRPANDGWIPLYKGLWELATIEMPLVLDDRGLARVSSWAPRPGAIRRSVFEAVGGFDTRFPGADLEDMDLGYRIIKARHPIFLAPGVRVKHNYPETLGAELRAFTRRAVLWTRMRRTQSEMDSGGEGGPRQAVTHLCGFAACLLGVAGLLWPLALVPAGMLTLVYLGLNGPFLRLAAREEGLAFAAGAVGWCFLHTLVLGGAAAYGLITMPARGGGE